MVSEKMVHARHAFAPQTDQKVRALGAQTRALILNWFRAKKAFSCGIVEGFNRNINLTIRKAYGFKSFEVLKIALFHTMGDLPEPEITHRFC